MSSRKIDIFAWKNNLSGNFQNMHRTIVTDPRGKTPHSLALHIKQQVQELNPGQISLRFWKEFNVSGANVMDYTDPITLFREGGNIDGLWQYWRDFFFYLEKEGIEPDFLIHDMEQGFGFWNIKNDDENEFFFRTLFDRMDEVQDLFPDHILNSTYDDFMNDVNLRLEVSRIAGKQLTNMLRRVFNEIVFYIYGKTIPHSNYKDINPAVDVSGERGRSYLLGARSMTEISSPVVYLDDTTRGRNGIIFQNMDKHPRWNKLIEKLNLCISCLKSDGPVVPWISPPGYGRYGSDSWANQQSLHSEVYIWYSMMELLQAMGIHQYILWNPPARWNPHAEWTDQIMDRFSFNRMVDEVDPQSLNLIEYDADTIQIGETVVHYAFLQNIL